jgi:hypothetical protein
MLVLSLLPLIVLMGVGTGLALGVRGTDVQVLALALITGAIALVPLTLDFLRPAERRHLMLFFLMFAFLVYFVLSVFTTYFFAATLLDRPDPGITDLKGIAPSDIVRGQIVVLVGLIAMLAGYAIPIARVVPIPRPRREWSYPSTLVVALITIPFGWAIYLSAQYGILPKRVGSGFVGAFSNATYFGIALLMLSYLRYRSFAALVLMGLLVPPTMAFNYFTSARGMFFAPIVVTMIAFIVVNRRIRLRWILAAFLAMSIFYPISEFQRQVILQGNSRSAAWALRRPAEVASKTTNFVRNQDFGRMFATGATAMMVRFDGLGIASVIVRDCPSRVPFQGGWTLAQIPMSYIPRLVWKDKPNMTSGGWVTEHFAGGPGVMSSTGSTWVGELWFNFGWPGIVIGMLVMGIFCRTLYEVLFKPPAVISAQLMSVIVLFAVPPTMAAALISTVNSVVFGAMPVVITHVAIRLMSGTLRPATAGDQESAALSATAHDGA